MLLLSRTFQVWAKQADIALTIMLSFWFRIFAIYIEFQVLRGYTVRARRCIARTSRPHSGHRPDELPVRL